MDVVPACPLAVCIDAVAAEQFLCIDAACERYIAPPRVDSAIDIVAAEPFAAELSSEAAVVLSAGSAAVAMVTISHFEFVKARNF